MRTTGTLAPHFGTGQSWNWARQQAVTALRREVDRLANADPYDIPDIARILQALGDEVDAARVTLVEGR